MVLEIPFTNKFTNILGDSEKKSKILSFAVIALGILFIIAGILVFTSDSEKIVDNVLSGETEAYGVILSIIGLLIIGGTIFTRFSFGDHFNKAFDGIKNLDNIDITSEKETKKAPKKQDKTSSENKIQKSIENVEEKPKTPSKNIKNETSTENAENKLKNTISQDKNSKPKDYKNIGKNIKSALNPTRIKIKNNSENSLQKEKPKKEKPKKEKIKKESKETNNTSVSFDDAMDSIEDLMEDSEK